MTHGLKLIDPKDSKTQILTPKCLTIISSGEKTMSNSLEGDNTYGEDVVVAGEAISQDDIAVIVIPSRAKYGVINSRFVYGGTLYASSQYADDEYTYYTRDPATGVMTAWSAGNMTAGTKSTWDPVLSIFPVGFWDKMGATTFTSVRLFAATCYLIYDTSASAYKKVYSIGNKGIETIQYFIAIKNYNA